MTKAELQALLVQLEPLNASISRSILDIREAIANFDSFTTGAKGRVVAQVQRDISDYKSLTSQLPNYSE